MCMFLGCAHNSWITHLASHLKELSVEILLLLIELQSLAAAVLVVSHAFGLALLACALEAPESALGLLGNHTSHRPGHLLGVLQGSVCMLTQLVDDLVAPLVATFLMMCVKTLVMMLLDAPVPLTTRRASLLDLPVASPAAPGLLHSRGALHVLLGPLVATMMAFLVLHAAVLHELVDCGLHFLALHLLRVFHRVVAMPVQLVCDAVARAMAFATTAAAVLATFLLVGLQCCFESLTVVLLVMMLD